MTNKVEVLLVPKEISGKKLADKLVVMIDVLRASSTIVTALARGCSGFIPIYSPEKAKEKVKCLRQEETLLCGERNGMKIKGFDLGNSPRKFKEETIKNKKIVFTTTNGVKVLELARDASEVIICSFLNLNSVCDYCFNSKEDVLIICAGREGKFSLEDAVCAGMLVDSIKTKSDVIFPETDAGITVQMLYKQYEGNIFGMLKKSQHGQYLISIGLKKDLEFCSSVNLFNIVPKYKDGIINRCQ